ncbi:MAG TPA: hypothetical protein VES19_08320 [Candidatus Limnocylindrales bacterium]|nr:hypothetical protein [Candidatus Limnocylindrales bacterium]
MRGVGPGDADGPSIACPRCGEAVAPELPSVAEILAARRTPLREG